MASKNVTVLVAGSWGTSLASVLADNGLDVTLWSKNLNQVDEINQLHTNTKVFPNISLSSNIHGTASMKEAMESAEAVIVAAPSHSMRDVVRQLKPFIHKDTSLIHATKGFEMDSLKRMTMVIADELEDYDPDSIVVLSGPSHAEEVILKCPTTVVVASQRIEIAEKAQDLLINSYFRVYTNADVAGVELGGALKNIIALGAGLSDGLGFGDNAKAALMTRGLAEISRLGIAMGANPMTFSGLAGVGDLMVTCTSKHSRNWRAGYLLAQGKSVEDILEIMGMVVEGIKTTRAAYSLSRQYQVEMPIADELYHVLFDNKDPKLAVIDLMGRSRTHEMEDVIKLF